MNLVLIEIIAAAVLVVILIAAVVAVLGRTRYRSGGDGATDPAAKAGPFAGARAVVDRSLGMYAFRRLTGRPTDRDRTGVEPPKEGPGDEVRVRAGVTVPGAAATARAGDVHGRDPSAPSRGRPRRLVDRHADAGHIANRMGQRNRPGLRLRPPPGSPLPRLLKRQPHG